MSDGTPGRDRKPPQKPHPDFPLFPHQNGLWAKKVRGKLHYFGPWRDPDAALAKWLAEKDDLLAGRKPRSREGLTLQKAVAEFLAAKEILSQSGELSHRTLEDYARSCQRMLDTFGSTRLVNDVRPSDFTGLRGRYANWAPATISAEVQRVRILFRWLYESGLIDHPVRFGPDFRKPSQRTLRVHRQSKGLRMFERAELLAVLGAVNATMRAMTLLGINAGLGNADCGRLRWEQIKGEWLDYPRPKTGVPRRCWLWPETLDALPPRQKTGLVFVTRFGSPWWRNANDATITNMFMRLLKRIGIYRPGLHFYALRHTTETIGSEAKDQPALDTIMGHAPSGMASVYRERIGDDRIRAVSEHIRGWLFADS